MNPFDIVTDISSGKKNLIGPYAENEKDYQPFLVNKAFSYFPDTLFFANLMNTNSHIDKTMQHDYLFYSIPKKKRFEKWSKIENSEAIDAIKKVYGYSNQKAYAVLSLLNSSQISILIEKCSLGGVK